MSAITKREFNPDTDTGIIVSTWPKGFYYSGLNIGIKPSKKQWFEEYYAKVMKCLAHGSVSIACLHDDPATIVGYAVIGGDTLEWIYVKELFRNQGIAKLLIKNKNINHVANLTKIGKAIADKHHLKEKLDGRTENRQEK